MSSSTSIHLTLVESDDRSLDIGAVVLRCGTWPTKHEVIIFVHTPEFAKDLHEAISAVIAKHPLPTPTVILDDEPF